MTPALSASPTSILISSSVTVLSLSELPPKRRKITRVEVLSSQMAGAATLEISSISGATAQATLSGWRRANCLGTSSPMTMEKNVMRPITMPKPEGFGNPGRNPVRGQDLRQPGAEGRAREGTGEDAHEGDADLDGREKAPGILHQLQGDLGARTAFFGHGFEAGTAGGNDGEFRQGKNAVEGDQADSDDEFEQRSQELPTASGRVSPLL